MATELEDIVAEMTIERLAQLGGRSVSEIAVYAFDGASAPARDPGIARTRGRVGTRTRAATQPNRSSTRADPRGNKYERAAAYTGMVRDVVLGAKGPIAAPEIRSKVGGTAARLQLALKRLIADGTITHDGRATSSRRYSAG